MVRHLMAKKSRIQRDEIKKSLIKVRDENWYSYFIYWSQGAQLETTKIVGIICDLMCGFLFEQVNHMLGEPNHVKFQTNAIMLCNFV